MIGIIWSSMMILSIICAISTNHVNDLCNSILEGSKQSINIIIIISGSIIFWSGMMKIAQDSKFTKFICKLFSPILKLLFKDYIDKPEVIEPMCINIVSNLLSLSNAATPSGIETMKKMKKNELMDLNIMKFLMINISCIQLSPNFLIISRKQFGAQNPYEVLPKIWMCSLIYLLVGIFLINLFSKRLKTERIRKTCLKT